MVVQSSFGLQAAMVRGTHQIVPVTHGVLGEKTCLAPALFSFLENKGFALVQMSF